MKLSSVAVHHERRHADRGQHVAHVELADQVEDPADRRRGSPPAARAGPAHSMKPGSLALARRDGRPRPSPRPSARCSSLHLLVAQLGAARPSRSRAPRWRARRWRTGRARRSGPGCVAANSAAIGPPSSVPQIAALLRAGRVHHGEHVVHLLLERRRAEERVGQAGAAPVERDHAGELGQARHDPLERRLGPEVLHLGDPGRNPDEVDRARRPRRRRRCGGHRSSRSAPRVPRRVTLQSGARWPSAKQATSSWSASRPRASSTCSAFRARRRST